MDRRFAAQTPAKPVHQPDEQQPQVGAPVCRWIKPRATYPEGDAVDQCGDKPCGTSGQFDRPNAVASDVVHLPQWQKNHVVGPFGTVVNEPDLRCSDNPMPAAAKPEAKGCIIPVDE